MNLNPFLLFALILAILLILFLVFHLNKLREQIFLIQQVLNDIK